MLPYEEHLRAGGGAEFKIPETPLPTKPRGIRGRKPLPRGRKPGPKPKEKLTAASSPSRTVSGYLGVFLQKVTLSPAKLTFCSSSGLDGELQRLRGGEEGPGPAAGHPQQGHADRPGQAARPAAGQVQSSRQASSSSCCSRSGDAAAESSASRPSSSCSQQHAQGTTTALD